MGVFSDYLSRKIAVSSPSKEEHPSAIVSGALEEARELGQSVADMFHSKNRRTQLEEMDLKFRGPQ